MLGQIHFFRIIIRGLPLLFCLAILSTCGPTVPIRFPKYPEGVYGQQLRAVMGAQKTLGIIAPDANAVLYGPFAGKDFSRIVESEVEKAINERGYYEFVDLKHRKQRLRELAKTQTGLFSVQKMIGQEQAADALLVVQMAKTPKTECKVEHVFSVAKATWEVAKIGYRVYMESQGHGTWIMGDPTESSLPTGVLYMTLFIKAKMVNIETGRSVAYSYAKPFRQISKPGNLRCPSGLKAFDESVKVASQQIADHLSPKIDVHDVALETDVGDVDENVAGLVKGYLKEGFKFAESDNLEAASEQWEEALAESGGRSAAAFWNLAAYKWYAGDMDQAQDYFRKAMRVGGPGWLDDSKRETYALFKSEYKRQRLGQ